PAARQLLAQQYHGNQHFLELRSYLDEIGWPLETSNYAVVNGDLTGETRILEPSSTILNYECDVETWLGLSTTDALRMQAYSYPGNPYHPDALQGQGVLAHLKIEGLFSDVSVNYQTTGLSTNWDVFSAGYRNTMDQLVAGFNIIISDNSELQGCDGIQSWQYQRDHGFIPTFSALDLPYDLAQDNLEEYLSDHLSETPFVRVFGPSSMNEQHSFISHSILTELPNILLRDPISHPTIMDGSSPNNGNFNLAKIEYPTIGDLSIENGATFHVNSDTLLTHFSGPEDFLPTESNYQARTLGCGADVFIRPGGIMKIGGLDSSHTAELIFQADSRMSIEAGGQLIIEEGSKLIFEDNSYLSLDPGARIIIKDGGQLHIKSGSEMIANDPLVHLLGATSIIEIEGNLTIPELSQFELYPVGSEMGFLRFSGEGIHLWGSGSRLHVEGLAPEQKIIEVAEASQLWNSDDFDKVTLRNGTVELKDNAQIVMSANFRARDIIFTSNQAQDNGGVHVFRNNDFRSCAFQNVSLHGDLAYFGSHKLRVQQSTFTGQHTKCIVNGMGYTIKDCEFIGTHGLRSDNLTVPSLIADCFFDGQDVLSNSLRGIVDESNSELQIRDSQILNSGHVGISKTLGMISLSCNYIEGNQNGIIADGCLLNMTTVLGGGNNVVTGNGTNLRLHFAEAIALNYGCNQFSDPLEMNIHGSIYADCLASCNQSTNIPAAGNTWVSGGQETGPLPEQNTIYVYDECGGFGQSFCEGQLFTFEQYCETECLDGPLRDPWRPTTGMHSTSEWNKPYIKSLFKSAQHFH
ncbi:MAG: hypothetical protein HRT74_10885, partial [Flavobacteriales bacterium]|nr:hypothetical protein [Flavobacteriales bacterium]